MPTVGVFLFLTHRLECSVGRLSRIINGSFGTLFDLNSPALYLGGLDGPSGRCVAAPVRAAVHRIPKFMIPLYHRCTEVDVPISYNPIKICNERQEISCRRVDRLMSPGWLSPSWFVADLTVAEMAAHQHSTCRQF